MKKISAIACAITLLLALPTVAFAADGVRVTDPSTHVSASVLAESEDGIEITPGPASTYGAYVRADNAPNLQADQVEFSFNLKPKDNNHDRAANVTVTMDTEYAGWNAEVYIQHDGSVGKESEQVSTTVAEDGVVTFPMDGLSTVTVILDQGDSASTGAASETDDNTTTAAEATESTEADAPSSDSQTADNATQSEPEINPIVVGVVVVVVAAVIAGVVLVIRRRNTK